MSNAYDSRLTSLRGLASLWVVAGHCVEWGILPLSAAAGILATPYLGVDLFFVLSGFLLLRSLDANGSLKHYFSRRATRILPLYLGTVIAVWLLLRMPTAQLVPNLTFTALWLPGGGAYATASWYTFWSLQVEMLIYLCLPLIHRLSGLGKLRASWGMIGFSAASCAALILWPHSLSPTRSWVLSDWSLFFPWVGVYGVGVIAYLGRLPDIGSLWPMAFIPALLPQIPQFVAALAVAPIFGALCQRPPVALYSISLAFVGEISYSLYLVHLEFLEAWGWVGLLVAFPVAAAMEMAVRGRAVLRHFGPLLGLTTRSLRAEAPR